MTPKPRTRSPEPVACDCKSKRHVHGMASMYQDHRCGCTACNHAYGEYRAKRIGFSEVASTAGMFVATFPMLGGISEARAQRAAYDQLLTLTREQGVTVLGEWRFRVEHTGAGRFLTARVRAESSRPRAEVLATAGHFAYEHEQAHPRLARWVGKHLEEVAA